ncbi:MAG: hypothetical protein Q4D28_00475, partial [Prevotellaceae bacterium]|nr:hypothetical protein [Prevotellaceae bacterium]
LEEDEKQKEPERPRDLLDDTDIARFDSARKKKRKKKRKGGETGNANGQKTKGEGNKPKDNSE